MKKLLYCSACQLYTLKASCPSCKAETKNPSPAKFSPDDKYANYRRTVKAPDLKKEGLL